MTNLNLTTKTLDMMKDLDKYFVGFDQHWNRLSKLHDDVAKTIPNYPPYNIKKTGENTYAIEVAVAGFAKSDIDIEIDGDKLIIKGTAKEDDSDFVFKGIASRAFTRAFTIDDKIEVKNAELLNGMLQIFLEKIIPESRKPKKIEIGKKGEKQLLNENA